MSLSHAVYGYATGGEEGAKQGVLDSSMIAKVTDADELGDISLAYQISGTGARKAAEEAAAVAGDAQTQALNYLKEVERVPQKYRSAGLEALGSLYGLGSPEQNAAAASNYQNSAINQLMSQNTDAALRAGEQGIARNALATGGLRGGDVNASMYDYNTMFKNQQQQKMLSNYLSGLGGLSQTATDPASIANSMSNLGSIQAAGITGSAQAQQQGAGNIASIIGSFFSDSRLKENIKKIGEVNGHNWYSWVWNEAAKRLGLSGESQGVIAQEVISSSPEAIGINRGFYVVDYSKIMA